MTWPPTSYFRIPNAACSLIPTIGPHAWTLYSVLARLADQRGECYPSRPTLAHMCKMQEATTRRLERVLVQGGLVEIQPRFTASGTRRSNLYRLNGNPPDREGDVAQEGSAPCEGSAEQEGVVAPDDTTPCHGALGTSLAPARYPYSTHLLRPTVLRHRASCAR